MGNAPAKKSLKLDGKLPDLVHKIATNYITTQNFQDLAKLENQDYCNKLVVLTSKIFDEYLDSQEVEYLAQHMHLGEVVDKMEKGKVHYLARKDMNKLDVKNRVKKKRLCIAISKFYIKIAHIFAAIVKTINPEYSYKDQFGQYHQVSILDKNKMPTNFHQNANVKIPMTKKPGKSFCQHRINALTPVVDAHDGKQALYKVNICDVNNPGSGHKAIGPLKRVVSLGDEPGFPELKSLYMDKFDYRTGRFTGMSEASKKEFEKDMGLFYQAFTNKTSAPPNLSSFDNIPLMDFHNQPPCHRPDGFLVKQFAYDPNSSVYKEYAEHLEKMKKNATTGQEKLVGILKQLFIKKLEKSPVRKPRSTTTREAGTTTEAYPHHQHNWQHSLRQPNRYAVATGQQAWRGGANTPRDIDHVVYTLNPTLTHTKLDEIVSQTRKLILDLYAKCEKDFKTGIKLFEAIIEKKEQEKMEKQHASLKEQMDKLVQ